MLQIIINHHEFSIDIWGWVDNDWTYPWNCTYDISLRSIFMFLYVQGSFLCCGSAVLMVWFGLGTKNTGKGDVLAPQTWLEKLMRKCGLCTTRMNVNVCGKVNSTGLQENNVQRDSSQKIFVNKSARQKMASAPKIDSSVLRFKMRSRNRSRLDWKHLS